MSLLLAKVLVYLNLWDRIERWYVTTKSQYHESDKLCIAFSFLFINPWAIVYFYVSETNKDQKRKKGKDDPI